MRKNTVRQPNNEDVFTFQDYHTDAIRVRQLAQLLGIRPSDLLRDIVRFYFDVVDKEMNDTYIRTAAKLIDRDIQEKI